MTNNKQIAEDIASKLAFVPADDRILVKPLKPIMITKELPVVNKEPKSLDEAEQTEPKFEKRKVEANVRKGIVISLGREYTDADVHERMKCIAVGDTIYYGVGAGQSFEAVKDSRMLRRYDILAIEKAS